LKETELQEIEKRVQRATAAVIAVMGGQKSQAATDMAALVAEVRRLQKRLREDPDGPDRIEELEHELSVERGELAEVRRLYAEAQKGVSELALKLEQAADPQEQWLKPDELRACFKELP
jgi:hypothetical protein